ncbi:MAG: tripartite tricarboxylate transporter substrate-binding protein [Solirubrobacteraceae bacterium]
MRLELAGDLPAARAGHRDGADVCRSDAAEGDLGTRRGGLRARRREGRDGAGGRLRALGVTSKAEAPQLPGVPPIAKTVPGFENTGWFGLVAPAGTPDDIIQKVYRDTKKALEDTTMKARFYAQGLAPVGNSPQEMATALKEETALWAKVVRERKISVK